LRCGKVDPTFRTFTARCLTRFFWNAFLIFVGHFEGASREAGAVRTCLTAPFITKCTESGAAKIADDASGDTLDDEEVLALLQDYNATGQVLHSSQ